MTRASRASILSLLLALSVASCRRAADPANDAAHDGKRYPISGVIRSLEASGPGITLEHGPVPGLMDAMTMPFPVHADPAVLARLRVGDRIAATLVMDGERFWLEGITSLPAVDAAAGAALPEGTPGVVTPHPNRGVPVGDAMPDFTLTDQTGRAVRLSQFAGQPVAVTFLYTRCPIATACPMTTAKFSSLDAMLHKEGFGQLLTLTVDPEHDTPAVLADYAKKAGADPKRWKFLTGDPKAVADVAERFGVIYYPDHGQVVHAQAVAVVDARGRLANMYYGDGWLPEHLLRDMEKARRE